MNVINKINFVSTKFWKRIWHYFHLMQGMHVHPMSFNYFYALFFSAAPLSAYRNIFMFGAALFDRKVNFTAHYLPCILIYNLRSRLWLRKRFVRPAYAALRFFRINFSFVTLRSRLVLSENLNLHLFLFFPALALFNSSPSCQHVHVCFAYLNVYEFVKKNISIFHSSVYTDILFNMYQSFLNKTHKTWQAAFACLSFPYAFHDILVLFQKENAP